MKPAFETPEKAAERLCGPSLLEPARSLWIANVAAGFRRRDGEIKAALLAEADRQWKEAQKPEYGDFTEEDRWWNEGYRHALHSFAEKLGGP